MGICSMICIKKQHEYRMKKLTEREKELKKILKEYDAKKPIIKEIAPVSSSSVELGISCTNLPNLDEYGYSDPVVFVYQIEDE